ncbi:MAG: DUF4127 family protein [Bacillota bacterium]|nr:DUF4127 family protein [Bacillota bacterium]
MNILYIPLDERPCNLIFPQMIAATNDEIKLIVPPSQFLGYKKQKADIEGLWHFVKQHIEKSDAAILSVDMLIYGGLLPSRIHHDDEELLSERLQKLVNLKNSRVPIYLFNLIMRTPSYNSSDEEPDYYEKFGAAIFKRAYLSDKKDRIGLSDEESKEQGSIKIPQEYVDDYEKRRKLNLDVNLKILDLVKSGKVDFLSIPQDDSSPYGYTAMDQRLVYGRIRELRLQNKVYVYPGADEAGSTLLARAYNDFIKKTPLIYVSYASTLGPEIIPLYEDRVFGESLKSHILAAGGLMTESINEADLCLFVNSPGKVMQQARDQFENRDVTYSSHRNLVHFCCEMEYAFSKGKKVAVADIAFANGGDLELISLMDDMALLDKLYGYAGWNTACNTLGTTLSSGIISQNKNSAVTYNLIYHIIDDALYQARIRSYACDNILSKYNADYFSTNGREKEICSELSTLLSEGFKELIINSFKDASICLTTYSPWKRMFEIGLNLEINLQV